MSTFEVTLRILGSVWGVGSMVAILAGVSFWIIAKAIRKAKPGSLPGEASADLLRFAAVLACLFAVAGLAVATVREFQEMAALARQEAILARQAEIRKLVLELKGADPTQARQAREALVVYGGDAARELVKAISEEAAVEAARIFRRIADGDWWFMISLLMGRSSWRTPFFESSTACLGRIGAPAVPPILDQLAAESAALERLRVAARSPEQPQEPSLEELFSQLLLIVDTANEAARVFIVREILKQALVAVGRPAIPALLKGVESPQFLVKITSYEVLSQMPDALQSAQD